jgi:hypothetical protein
VDGVSKLNMRIKAMWIQQTISYWLAFQPTNKDHKKVLNRIIEFVNAILVILFILIKGLRFYTILKSSLEHLWLYANQSLAPPWRLLDIFFNINIVLDNTYPPWTSHYKCRKTRCKLVGSVGGQNPKNLNFWILYFFSFSWVT